MARGDLPFPTMVVGSLPRPPWVMDLDEACLKLSAMCGGAGLLREQYG